MENNASLKNLKALIKADRYMDSFFGPYSSMKELRYCPDFLKTGEVFYASSGKFYNKSITDFLKNVGFELIDLGARSMKICEIQ